MCHYHTTKPDIFCRTKGFARIIETLDTNRVKYVYDIALMMNTREGAEGKITNALMGKKMMADLYVRRIDTKDIPKVYKYILGQVNFFRSPSRSRGK